METARIRSVRTQYLYTQDEAYPNSFTNLKSRWCMRSFPVSEEDHRSRSQERKRKLPDDEEGSDSSPNGSPKKQRLNRIRGSSKLRNQYNSDADSSLPTPQVTGDEEEAHQLGKAQAAVEESGNFEDDLEADLYAEFEAAGMDQEKG